MLELECSGLSLISLPKLENLRRGNLHAELWILSSSFSLAAILFPEANILQKAVLEAQSTS